MNSYLKKLISIFLFSACSFLSVSGGSNDQLRLVERKLPGFFPGLLKNSSIKDIYQDSKGFIWIASSYGLIKYDGYELKYFRHDKNNSQSIANSNVERIREDSKGNLWLGLYSEGISCYNPLTDSFKNYSTKSIMPQTNDQIVALYVDSKDEVWFSIGNKGLCHLKKESGTFETWDVVTSERCPNTKPYKVPLFNFLMDITDKDADNLWLGTPEGLFSFNKKTKEFIVMRPKFSKELHHDIYNAKKIIKAGRYLWIGGWGSAIQCYDTLNKTWSDYNLLNPNETYEASNLITDMVRKDDDEFWIASNDMGLATFNTTTRTFNLLKNNPDFSYLPKANAYLVFNDNQNNLYVGFMENFYFFIQKPNIFKEYKLNSYSKLNFGMSFLNCVFEPKSNRYLYAGTSFSDGIIRYDRLTNTLKVPDLTIGNKKIVIPYIINFIERDDESVWLLTSGELFIYYYDQNKIVLPTQPTVIDKLRGTNGYACMTKEKDDFIWLGTSYNGLIRYDIKSGNSMSFTSDSFSATRIGSNYIQCVLSDHKNNLWYGSARGSLLACFNKNTGKSTFYDKDGKNCSKSNSLFTFSLYTDGKNVFACTIEGLLIFDISGKEPKLIRKIDSENGYSTNTISLTAKENDSLLWICSLHGIDRFNLNNNEYEKLNEDDGLKNNQTSIAVSNRNNIFIGGVNAFFEYIPNSIERKLKATAPVLTSFKINETDININAAFNYENKIVIEPGYSYFTVSFASLDYANTTDLRYSYQLVGFNKNWIDAGERRYASFSNLSGGNYVLKLRATIDNGVNYSDVTSIPIYIETIYYKSWWFRLGLALVFSMLLFVIYKYRTQQQQAIAELNNRAQLLEKEKSVVQYENLKQQLNPHFLFNSLTSLSSLITVEPKIARQFVDQMSKIYRYILKSSENETVPLINEITFATTYVKLQQTRFEKGFIVNINVNEEYNDRKIVPVTIQNMIENAIKHNVMDEESPLIIDVFVEDEYLVVKNNLQRKGIVESSNKVGLEKMKSLYEYLSNRPIAIDETPEYYTIKIPLI